MGAMFADADNCLQPVFLSRRGRFRRRDRSSPGQVLARAIIARMSKISVTHFTDPGCPWAYSASPALAVLHWRYGDQLAGGWSRSGWPRTRSATSTPATRPTRDVGQRAPSAATGCRSRLQPRARVAATSRACRAIVATRLLDPGARARRAAGAAARAGSPPRCCSTRTRTSRRRSARRRARRPARSSPRSTTPPTLAAYEARQAADAQRRGRADRLPGQGAPDRRAGALLGAVAGLRERGRRAPGGRRLPADRGLRRADRQPRPDARAPSRRRRAAGGAARTSPTVWPPQEVAAIMAQNNQPPDRDAAERALIELRRRRRRRARTPLGDDALWQLA